MQLMKLYHGLPLQIMIPDGVERSRPGAIYLQVGQPTVITDAEAEHIRKMQADKRNGLGKFKIDIVPVEVTSPSETGTEGVAVVDMTSTFSPEPEPADPEPPAVPEPPVEPTPAPPAEPTKRAGGKRRKKV